MTRIDPTRLWSALVALGVAVVLAVVLAYVSSGVNRPPVIVAWQAVPASLARGASAVLRAEASDADGGPLQYEFDADHGQLTAQPGTPGMAIYRPPAEGIVDRVRVTVTDRQGLRATAETRVSIDLGSVATPTPAATEVSTAAPLEDATPRPEATVVASALTLPPTPLPPRPTPSAEPAEPPEPAPVRAENQAPVLEKGTKIEGIGTRSVTLVANGYDPDGDVVTHVWDTKGCFEIINESATFAEVKFGYCTWGVITLKWTDPGGKSATAEWTLSKE